MRCFFSTNLEKELACSLEVPLFATDWSLAYYGTKEGSRDIFKEVEIPHAIGTDLYTNSDDLAVAIKHMYEQNQDKFDQIVIKLNQSFSGEGNALLDMTNFNPKQDLLAQIKQRMANNLKFESQIETWPSYQAKLQLMGALAEGWVRNVKGSPSGQGWINAKNDVEIFSTHEQILKGQVYQGCQFPASQSYRRQLMEFTRKVGEALANKGCRDRFSVDYVCSPNAQNNGYDVYAVEINLRWGGTSHPFIEMSELIKGQTDQKTGEFIHCESQQQKFYVATDNFKDNYLMGCVADDLLQIINKDKRLQFDFTSKKGVVFHLFSCASEIGKIGYTAIGNSNEEAQQLFNDVQNIILNEVEPMHKLKSFTKLDEATSKKEAIQEEAAQIT